jgi:hypothetical protein
MWVHDKKNEEHWLGAELRTPSNSEISHVRIPMPAVPIPHQIKPHPPSSLLKKLHRSQQIAHLGILDNKIECLDSAVCNPHSQAQVQRITQKTILACICTYGEVMGRPITARHTAQQQFPTNMLYTVPNKTTGQLMEMWHLLVCVFLASGSKVGSCKA